MDENPIAIHVSDISKRYPGQTEASAALKNVSFDIPMGKILCLLGPNGSGKTTLLKIMAGLLSPTTGSITILGHDHVKDGAEVRSHIGWMPADERSTFYGRLTGRENIDFFAALHRVPESDLDRVVGNISLQIGLGEEINEMMLKTSGGARQKIALMRALLHNPSILILDEPLRNLDPHTLRRFRRLIKDHLTRLQKKTIILSTHQLDEAQRLADIIMIVNDGKIIKTLTGRDIETEFKDVTVEDYYLKTIDRAQQS